MTDSVRVLADTVVVFGTALTASLAARLLAAPAIVGFLAAGMIIGPSGFGLLKQEDVHAFAEIGLVLLLFTVGLELSPAPLFQMGFRLIGATLLQMGGTAAAIALALNLMMGVPWPAAILLGVAASPASTAIVLKQLSDRGETDSVAGSVSTGILLLQDVITILVLIALPIIGNTGGGWTDVAKKAAISLGGLAAVTVIARLLMPTIVRMVFRDSGRETMTLFAVVMAVAGAWAAGAAEWSPALGAAIAGMLLASTDVRHQLFAEILPFREVFNALFFVAIGMLVNLHVAWIHAGTVTVAIIAALVGKAVLAALGVQLMGWPSRIALTVGLGLSTISEFGYVLGSEAARMKFVPTELLELFIVVAVGTMLAGALLVPISARIAMLAARGADKAGTPTAAQPHAAANLSGHVIVVGYGLNGHNLASVLKATGVKFNVIEMNPALARQVHEIKAPVILGDAARQSILEHAGVENARAVVVCINDPDATRRIVVQVRAKRPDVYLLVRTRYVAELESLYKLGASQVIPEEFETSIEIFAHLLHEFSIPGNVIEQQIALVRVGRYGMLRGMPTDRQARSEWARMLETAVTQTFLLPETSPLVGHTIGESNLRKKTGVTIVAITRDGHPVSAPGPDMSLAAGDVLVLVGSHQQLDQARKFLGPQDEVTKTRFGRDAGA